MAAFGKVMDYLLEKTVESGGIEFTMPSDLMIFYPESDERRKGLLKVRRLSSSESDLHRFKITIGFDERGGRYMNGDDDEGWTFETSWHEDEDCICCLEDIFHLKIRLSDPEKDVRNSNNDKIVAGVEWFVYGEPDCSGMYFITFC